MINTRNEFITPQMAAVYLATSQGNRSLKRGKVAAYSRDMIAGKWQNNGETIIFNDGGVLIDGHHRLKACTICGIGFMSIVVTGVSSDSSKTIDMGASRSHADVLSFHGVKNVNNVTAIIRILLSLKTGRARSANPSMQEVFEFIDEHPQIVDSARFATKKRLIGTDNFCGAVHFIAAGQGIVETAEAFGDVLSSGVPAYSGCAAHALRERVLQDAAKHIRMSPAGRLILAASAWNKFVDQVPVKVLKPGSEFRVMGY